MSEEVGSATIKLIVTLAGPDLSPSAACYESLGDEGEIVAVKVVVRVKEGEAIVGKAELGERGRALARHGLSVVGDWLGVSWWGRMESGEAGV